MIELDDFFDPIGKGFSLNRFAHGSYGKYFLGHGTSPKLGEPQIAIFGVSETRNAFDGQFDPGVDKTRLYLYNLSKVARLNVVDLGNLKLGKTVKDTYASIQLITSELLKKNITPVVFGGSQDICVPFVRAINETEPEPFITVVDARVDADDDEFHSRSFINRIDSETKGRGVFSIVGYQSYFVAEKSVKTAQNKHWNLYRLGAVRNNLAETEPVLRDSDLVSFDVSSIRQTDCPASTFNSPNGLYAEEACQLGNLSGLSDKLKLFSISEFQAQKDVNGQSAHLVAQIIWYFLYGYSLRKGDYPKKKLAGYKKIYVKLQKIDADLVFYENQQNKRFWVEIPVDNKQNTKIFACSETDYIKACNNEIPDTIWRNVSRYLK